MARFIVRFMSPISISQLGVHGKFELVLIKCLGCSGMVSSIADEPNAHDRFFPFDLNAPGALGL